MTRGPTTSPTATHAPIAAGVSRTAPRSAVRDSVLADLCAHIRTIPPVSNRVVTNKLPFPYNIRALMIAWNMLFFDRSPFAADPSKSAQVNCGAYLVEGPEHCGTCHTTNAFGGDVKAAAYQGISLQGWYAPDLSNNAHTGLGEWITDDIVTYLHNSMGNVAPAVLPGDGARVRKAINAQPIVWH